MNSNRDEPSILDLMAAALSGTCSHELKLQRVMGVIGALLARTPGRAVTIDFSEIEKLEGKYVTIEQDDKTGSLHLQLRSADEAPKSPTHAAPPTQQ
ncbi:hypothetical protein P9A47_gp53 [Xanthomonas phage Elanor]|uniref:Uncharacterized protein n=1 Tax=Xanthomonas phage Elanor TaxID=2939127 RepID=A0A9E7E1U5_9CAUD|nr:hypothetical protein P9A47_gp53 [Xanthomonas phage Elanor]URA07021.1 hypothetical protein Elanor_BL40053 [Xanthomonas phage Elanor]